MNHIAVLLEHVDLLNCLDRLDVELLQGLLELAVVGSRCLVHLLGLPAWCALATTPC